MANSVVPQADIGALSLRGLSVFKTVLEACSADNVSPAAMIQLSSLGDSFLISGPYADKVPDNLQRHSSVVVDRLSLSVGWRKGDASSFMATSTGGQAISLLCLCLFSLYKKEHAGEILRQLSRKLLSHSDATSSITQMVEVGWLLKNKLQAIGFGNILAKQTLRIFSVFEQLGNAGPTNFLEQISSECMSEIIECISRALKEENKILRITGSRGLGHILGMILIMFPDDTLVTVNGLVTFEGPRRRIVVEVNHEAGKDEDTHFRLENQLNSTTDCKVPICTTPVDIGEWPPYTFRWKNWIGDNLRLCLYSVGCVCTTELLSACCNVLEFVPVIIGSFQGAPRPMIKETMLPTNVLRKIFNTDSERFRNCCALILGPDIRASTRAANLRESISQLKDISSKTLSAIDCRCGNCDLRIGQDFSLYWESNPPQQYCPKWRGWGAIALCLDHAFGSYFVDSAHNIGVRPSNGGYGPGAPILRNLINQYLGVNSAFHEYDQLTCENLFDRIRRSVSLYFKHGLVSSSAGSTFFPKVLYQLTLSEEVVYTFDLLDGRILFEGNPFSVVTSEVTRQKALEVTASMQSPIIPSSIGVHTKLTHTLKESTDGRLLLRTTARCEGQDVNLDLESIVKASFGLQQFDSCPHSVLLPLIEVEGRRVLATSIANPYPELLSMENYTISIVQTRHNKTAQLLACRPDTWMYLLRDCCLNCAVAQILKDLEANQHEYMYLIRHVLIICA